MEALELSSASFNPLISGHCQRCQRVRKKSIQIVSQSCKNGKVESEASRDSETDELWDEAQLFVQLFLNIQHGGILRISVLLSSLYELWQLYEQLPAQC